MIERMFWVAMAIICAFMAGWQTSKDLNESPCTSSYTGLKIDNMADDEELVISMRKKEGSK